MGFSLEKKKSTDVPMHRAEAPMELWNKHKGILKDHQHIYTDFTCNNVDENWIVSVDIAKSRKFGLHYLRHKVRQYCESREQLVVSTGKIKDIILYVKLKDQDVPNVTKYCQYSLRIQDRRVSDDFEMVVSYCGLTYVYNCPLSQMGHLNDEKYIGRVVIGKNIYSYKDDYAYICNRI